ncbi:MAG: UDP-N-acetylglucosamine 1-carboxyvinyltransferase [Candidatus Babeliales bacterium]
MHYLDDCFVIEKSPPLKGMVSLQGSNKSVLSLMVSLLLTDGVSTLHNVPFTQDVTDMARVLESLGAKVTFYTRLHKLVIDTSYIFMSDVAPEMVQKLRESLFVMGPLLRRTGAARFILSDGGVTQAQFIAKHGDALRSFGVTIDSSHDCIKIKTDASLRACKVVLDVPCPYVTSTVLMAASGIGEGTTLLINASLDPEVTDLIALLCSMGAVITVHPPATISIRGKNELCPVDYTLIVDRTEAGLLLLAAAASGGEITIPEARVDHLAVLLEKLEEMGHAISYGEQQKGVNLQATSSPQTVSCFSGIYPCFPQELQASMMVVQCLVEGASSLYEQQKFSSLGLVSELRKMGACIDVYYDRACIQGVDRLYGADVIAHDAQSASALVIAGLLAEGTTVLVGARHWKRAYENTERTLKMLGGSIKEVCSYEL